MFILPILLIVIAGVAVYKFMHRSAQPAARGAGGSGAPGAVAMRGSDFWPTTIEGKLGIAAFVLGFVPWVLVNVIQIPYASIAIQLAAMVLAGVARFVKHDRSMSVLIVVIVSAFAIVASVLFVLGEVFIGHD